MPTTVLIWCMQSAESDGLYRELYDRVEPAPQDRYDKLFETEALYRWQWRWIARICIDRLREAPLSRNHPYQVEWLGRAHLVLIEDEIATAIEESFVRLSTHPGSIVRAQCAEGVCNPHDIEGSVKRLEPLVQDLDLLVRKEALSVLKYFVGVSERAEELALAGCDDTDADVRESALSALGWAKPSPEVLHKVREMADDEHNRVRRAQVFAMIELLEGEEEVAELKSILRNGDSERRRMVLLLMAGNAGSPHIEAFFSDIVAALEEEDWEVRIAATTAFREIGTARFMPFAKTLQRLLEDEFFQSHEWFQTEVRAMLEHEAKSKP